MSQEKVDKYKNYKSNRDKIQKKRGTFPFTGEDNRFCGLSVDRGMDRLFCL